jgi:Holliday junction resolvasome RuvABC ATP-dependent DNA helicase subunit
LERRRYQFAGAREPVPFTQLTLVSATTDFALCHPALRSRLTKVFLQRVPPADMVAALRLRPFPATTPALEAIVSRTHHGGVMRDVIEAYKQAVVSAKARGATTIDVQDVERVWQFNRVDAYGLQEPERAVIRALLQMPRTVRGRRGEPDTVQYVGSESNVTQVAGVDLGAYRVIHRPRLMQRGLLTTASSGQQLTAKALELYGALHG